MATMAINSILKKTLLKNITRKIFAALCFIMLLSCSQDTWEGSVKSHELTRNDKRDIIGVTLILHELPEKQFFVPREIARGQLILEMGDIVYGLNPEGRIKIKGSKKNHNIIEVTQINFSGKASVGSQSTKSGKGDTYNFGGP
jgi:hypothetical protein